MSENYTFNPGFTTKSTHSGRELRIIIIIYLFHDKPAESLEGECRVSWGSRRKIWTKKTRKKTMILRRARMSQYKYIF